MRQYILSVISVGILCGLVQMLFSDGSMNSLVKLITGLMISLTVISPLLRDEIFSAGSYLKQNSFYGEWAIEEGKEAAMNTVSEIIREKTESYILNKASELGADIAVEIKLGEQRPPAPAEVMVKGTLAPYTKVQLSDFIKQELGIAEEKQIWIS